MENPQLDTGASVIESTNKLKKELLDSTNKLKENTINEIKNVQKIDICTFKVYPKTNWQKFRDNVQFFLYRCGMYKIN